MGSLGNCIRGHFFGEIRKSTNKVDVAEYFLKLKDSLSTRCKPYVILDNAAAHHAHSVKRILKRYFRPMFLPAYSCRFNSIELLWACIKQKVLAAHTQMMFKRESSVEHMKMLVTLTCDEEISAEIFTKILRANKKYINSFLSSEK